MNNKKAFFKTVFPYQGDRMNLPVVDVDVAIPYYEKIMGFRLISRRDTPHKSAVLSRDAIEIGLSENGGDPEQDGCFFEVDDVETAFSELKANGFEKKEADFQVQRFGSNPPFKVFFVVAPDGLCYCLGEKVAN